MSRQFIIIPFRAIEDRALEAKHIQTLCALGGHTDKMGICKVRQTTIANLLGISRKSVNEYLGHLSECGYVEKTATKRKDGGNGAIQYRVIIDAPPVTPSGYTPCNAQGLHPLSPPSVTAITSNDVILTEEKDISKDIYKKTDLPSRVFNAWNAMAINHNLTKVKTNILNANRSKEILKRLADCKQDESLLFDAIENVPNNPHWLGHNDRNWKASFDFIFKQDNFSRALECETYTPPKGGTNGKYQSRDIAEADRKNNAAFAALAKRRGANADSGQINTPKIEARN